MEIPPSASAPSRDVFDEAAYVQLHADVAAAIAAGVVGSGWQHYTLHGRREGRAWVPQPDRMSGVSRDISPHDEMFAGDAEHYFDVGESALHAVQHALGAVHRPASSVRRILDLPCGHGRVLRFLRAAFPQAELTACDLNRDGVEFCARTFGAQPVTSHVDAERIPLSGEFDLIWCGSLLTHLPREQCLAFLRLFHRVLASGGLVVFTLHGRHYESELISGRRTVDLAPEQIDRLVAAYRQHGFGYVDYATQRGYGFSLASPGFATGQLIPTAPWQLVGYHERGWDRRQDVIALRKPV